jgi:hypothetical protein
MEMGILIASLIVINGYMIIMHHIKQQKGTY